jgi:hypothetical protein
MTVDDLVDLFIDNDPMTLEEIQSLGIRMKEIDKGEGAFRDVYKVRGLPLVVKIPKNSLDGIDHAIAELKAIRKINTFKKYAALVPYLPTVYYCSWRSGIVVMDYCKPLKWSVLANNTCRVLDSLVSSLWSGSRSGVECTDICTGNVGIYVDPDTDQTQLKLIDLGCFLEN